MELNMIKSRIIVLFLNTTGSTTETNQMIELAAIEIKRNSISGVKFHNYLKPETSFTQSGQKKSKLKVGFYSKHHEGYLNSNKDILANFLEFTNFSPIFSFFPSDCIFINKELSKHSLYRIEETQFVSISSLFYETIKTSNPAIKKQINLEDIKAFFNIDDAESNALEAASSLAKVLISLHDYANDTNNVFRSRKIPSSLIDYNVLSDIKNKSSKKAFTAIKNGDVTLNELLKEIQLDNDGKSVNLTLNLTLGDSKSKQASKSQEVLQEISEDLLDNLFD